MDCLRPSFADPANVHIDKDCRELTGRHVDQLFHACVFDKLNGLTLERCVLDQSKFITSKIEDALGFTLTLDCNSFADVELSPLVFDLILCLLIKTKGNTAKRKEILSRVLGRERADELLKSLKTIE